MATNNPAKAIRTSTPRSLYVHVPFCRHRCGYCNFSLVANRDYLVQRYLDAIESEVTWLPPSPQPIELETLYFGGGTPSRLSTQAFQRLLDILTRRFRWNPKTEFTVECNPSDLDDSKLDALESLGVNRISLGVQSLNGGKLKLLERDHQPDAAIAVIQQCIRRFKNVSLDMIFATPGETLTAWQNDLRLAASLQPQHFSTYELTYEKGTTFWNRLSGGELKESNDDLKTEMYEWTINYLEQLGYEHYEVSSFALPGHRSRHNSVYWTGKPYYAFGPGAAGYLYGVRETRHQSPMTYLKMVEAGKSPIVESEKLEGLERTLERLVVALRQRTGIEIQEFDQENDCHLRSLLEPLRSKLAGLVEMDEKRLIVTRQGLLVNDWIAEQILRLA